MNGKALLGTQIYPKSLLVRFGFATGCEAVATPRRQQPDYFPGYALGSGLAPGIDWAKGRTKGIAQEHKALLRRGLAAASHPAAKPNFI